MLEQVVISAKNLGAAAMPDYCPRCFWLRLHGPSSMPWGCFPAIFSQIDRYTKKLVDEYYADHHQLPMELCDLLGEVAENINPPHWSSYKAVFTKQNILVRGEADAIYRHPDKTVSIIDYKTAMFKGKDDRLYPIYDVQLNAYACIAEYLGLGTVKQLSLLYMEPLTALEDAKEATQYGWDYFMMKFKPKVLDVPVDPSVLDQPLDRCREVFEMQEAPKALETCSDCRKLDQIIRLLEEGVNPWTAIGTKAQGAR